MQISVGDNEIILGDKHFARNLELKWTYFSKTIASSENFADSKISGITAIITTEVCRTEFQRNHWSRSPQLESPSKFSCEVVLEFRQQTAVIKKELPIRIFRTSTTYIPFFFLSYFKYSLNFVNTANSSKLCSTKVE